ncbi:MAG TPA: ribulose-phosphate 3-epimerase [Defluviitaleaceae bacterium]|nr:ribulose-phosphate 3-epimerase [Defluviitaleaceae bacterium]HPT77037.1 ribulose-phosphate 3-epimerase [Defluviitaleaceae bacterium]HQD49733.1 ribulose-phosphate 3-epimerase [Defluviitaleaceae bacterium]
MIKLAPSILSADFANLGRDVRALHDAGVDYIHIDIMDGGFVPVITFGSQLVKAIRKYSDKVFDVHLMVNNPDAHIKNFVEAGADIISVHAESCVHLHRTIQCIKNYGLKAGVVLNPSTPLSSIEYILEDVDMVLIMSVNPGYGGQKFIDSAIRKISALREMINSRGLNTDIEVDGGITFENVQEVIRAGANVIVAGSSVFKGDIHKNIKEFNRLFKEVN